MAATTLLEAFENARTLDAPLAERLDTYARSVRELNRPMAEAIDRLISRLHNSGASLAAPNVGDVMPPFVLSDHTGQLIALSTLISQGPTAITFARGHWCPYCQIAISALGDIAGDAKSLGASIVAIVPDQQNYAAKLKAEANAPFPILTDVDNGYALALGLVFWVGDEIQRYMLTRSIDLSQSQGNDSWFVPVPATFVVGKDGKVIARHVDPDYRKRMAVDAVLDALKAAART